jgi:hypothetical protein
LDLGIIVGPEKPDDINLILSGPLPIIFDYKCRYKGITSSALGRMRAALEHHHHDRVREITFEETSLNFEEFFEVTDCAFPVLESLSLRLKYCGGLKFPDTFIRGPDLSNLSTASRIDQCFFRIHTRIFVVLNG